MLTQYDIEEVQEHCDNLCGSLSFYLFVDVLPFLFAILESNALFLGKLKI